jgi:hypothetical protein
MASTTLRTGIDPATRGIIDGLRRELEGVLARRGRASARSAAAWRSSARPSAGARRTARACPTDLGRGLSDERGKGDDRCRSAAGRRMDRT